MTGIDGFTIPYSSDASRTAETEARRPHPPFFFLSHFYFPAFGQAVVTGVVLSSPRFLPSIFIAHRVQQSHCSSIIHRVLLTHALALSAIQFVHKKKSNEFTRGSMHSAGLEFTKLTYTRLENNLIRHRGDRSRRRACQDSFREHRGDSAQTEDTACGIRSTYGGGASPTEGDV